MSETQEVTEAKSEQDAAAEVLAGYNHTARAEKAPVEKVISASVPAVSTQVVEPDPAVAEPDVKTLADELQTLKARISTSSGDSQEIRKLHGAVGDINRTLKALQNPAQPTPDDSELSAALASAESVAQEYPELAGPLVKALKLSMSRQAPKAQPEDFTERISSEVTKIRQQDAIESLQEEHPDYVTVRETPEYKTWLASKTPEYQERFNNTWNPAVVAKGLTEFKDSLKVRAKKQDRLAAAVTPQGVPQQAKSSTLPDEEGLNVGYYQKGRKRLT